MPLAGTGTCHRPRKPGTTRVTTKGDDRVMATRVEALDKNERFPKGDGSETEKKERDKN
jgi:hypothetical protein